MNLSTSTKLMRVSNAVTAATTAITSSAVDTKGFSGCMFTVAYGTIAATATNTVKAQQGSDDGVLDGYSDLEGTSITVADTDDNKIVAVDVFEPTKRYLKLVATRGVATTVIDGIFAQWYSPKILPTTHDTSTVVGSEIHSSPAEGTA